MKQKPILPGTLKTARPSRKSKNKPAKAQTTPATQRKQLRREIGNR